MPIYEYQCLQCGKTIELLQKVDTNQADAPCPACGATRFQKKISAANVSSSTATTGEKSPKCCGRGERPHSCGSGCCCGE